VCVYLWHIIHKYTTHKRGRNERLRRNVASTCRGSLSRSSRASVVEWGLRRVRLRATGMRARPRPYYPLILAGPKPLMYILYRASRSPPRHVLYSFPECTADAGTGIRPTLYIRVHLYMFHADVPILLPPPERHRFRRTTIANPLLRV